MNKNKIDSDIYDEKAVHHYEEIVKFIQQKEDKLLQLAILMERLNLMDYLNLLHRPARLIWINFLVGLARGFGIMMGASVLIFVFFYALKRLVNIPVLGSFIAEIVKFVQLKLYGNL